jgi:Tfp pilus assembly protein PilN
VKADQLNLAREPFLNERPVRRLAVLLWSVSALLLAVSVVFYGAYFVNSAEARQRLQQLRGEIERENELLAVLKSELQNLDLTEQNQKVLFLNERIAERTFPWGTLFDRLGDVLPRGVRLYSLAPQVGDGRDRGAAAALQGQQRVRLRLDGAAEEDEDLLALMDALFAHPAFEDPKLSRESRQGVRLIRFDIETGYLPRLETAGAGTSEGPKREELAATATSDSPPPSEEAAAAEAALAGVRQPGGGPIPRETVPENGRPATDATESGALSEVVQDQRGAPTTTAGGAEESTPLVAGGNRSRPAAQGPGGRPFPAPLPSDEGGRGPQGLDAPVPLGPVASAPPARR